MRLSTLLLNARTLRGMSILDAAKASESLGRNVTEDSIRRACQRITEIESDSNSRPVSENDLLVLARIYGAPGAELDRWHAAIGIVPRDIRQLLLQLPGRNRGSLRRLRSRGS
jgi:transcriptional regulator with XRE-family HTH domain